MLEKRVVLGLITILEDKQLQVREDTIISEEGKELARTYFRYTLSPGDDVSERHADVKALAVFLWTPLVIAAWKAKTADPKMFPEKVMTPPQSPPEQVN